MNFTMVTLTYLFKIVCYFFIIFLMYKIVKIDLKQNNNYYSKDNKKFLIIWGLILSLLYASYSLICGAYPNNSDRFNYSFQFENSEIFNNSKQDSIGLYWLGSILHLFTNNSDVLFFICAFIYMVITLIAFKLNKDIIPFAILAIGLSSYFICGFYLLKQAIAISLIALSFSLLKKDKKILFFLCVLLAICFHESALIMIIAYVLIYLSKYTYFRRLFYFVSFIYLIFFSSITNLLISVILNVMPSIENWIGSYLNNSGELLVSINYLTILKGLPIYIITIFGFLKRNEFKDKIKHYDYYMICCYLASFFMILSCHMYWSYRFALYFYFPTFIFAGLIYEKLGNKNERLLYVLTIIVALFGLTLKLWLQYYFNYGGL